MTRNDRFLFGGVLAAVLLAYLPSLALYFLSDDFLALSVYLLDGERVDWAKALSNFFPRWYSGRDIYRPVVFLSLLGDWGFFRAEPLGYHVQNLLLHALNVTLVFAVARRLLPRGPGPLFAAAFFGLSPVHPESVLWVVGRVDLMPTFFVLLALLAFLRFRDAGRRGFLALSVAAAVLAFGSKETAVALPLLLLAVDRLRGGRSLGPHIPFWLALGGYFVLRRAIFGAFFGSYGTGPSVLENFARDLPGLAGDLGRFFGAIVMPVRSSAPAAWRWLLLAPLAFLLVGRGPLRLGVPAVVAFLLTLPVVPLVTKAGLPITADLLNARMCYLPAAGFALVFGALAARARLAPVALVGLAAIDLVVLRANCGAFERGAEALRRLRDSIGALAVGRPVIVENPPWVLEGVYVYRTGLEASLAPPFHRPRVAALGLDLVTDEGFQEFRYRNRGPAVRARWEESVAHEVRDAPPGRVAWRGDELPARDAALPTGRVEALKLTARGPEGGSSAFRFEPADSRFGGEVRFPFRNGEVVVPLRFERSWYAARQVERFELALPPGAVVERVEALESLPSVEALEPPDGARVSLSGPEPAFAHRVFPGVRFYRLVLDLPVMGEVSALYDAARVLGREPRDGDEVRRPVSHGASLVRGLELDLRQVDREKFRDFELTWRVEAVADPARPWVVLAESGPRRLRLVP